MDYYTFAAIDVGSHEVSIKIFEISQEKGVKLLDYIHHTTLLGLETYSTGRISYASIDNFCNILNGYKQKMEEYKVSNYNITATSAVREASNNITFLDQVKQRTGFNIKILSNSEQRFLCYKSIALTPNTFHKSIKKGALLVDVGGGSIQISHFDKGHLLSTQNIKIGSLRIKEELLELENKTDNYNQLISEFIYNDIHTYFKLYIQSHEIKNIIAVGNQLRSFIKYLELHNFGNVIRNDAKGRKKDSVTREEYDVFYANIIKSTAQELMHELDTAYEQASLLLPTAMIYKAIFDESGAENMWLSDITICDGMAAEFAENKAKIKPAHSFEDDILTTAQNLANRYMCDPVHNSNVMENAMKIFDFLRKGRAVAPRDKLLLQLAVTLHKCGSFVNLNEVGENSFKIIMSTEIIGLSHSEKTIVAYVTRYTDKEFPEYSDVKADLSQTEYVLVSKLNAILRLVDTMDRSHKQKFKNVSIEVIDDKLYIFGKTLSDITLERGKFTERADFFEEVFGIRPELRSKNNWDKEAL